MTVLRSDPGVKCTLRATIGLLSSHDSPTSYRQWKFRRYDSSATSYAIVGEPTRTCQFDGEATPSMTASASGWRRAQHEYRLSAMSGGIAGHPHLVTHTLIPAQRPFHA